MSETSAQYRAGIASDPNYYSRDDQVISRPLITPSEIRVMHPSDLERVSARREEVKALLDAQPVNKPLLHPAMASRFQQSVMDLACVLNQEDGRAEASEHLRGLVDKVVLTPMADEDSLRIDLYGDLAGILNMAAGGKDMKNMIIIERLELSPSNDNSPQALQDRIGSGGWR